MRDYYDEWEAAVGNAYILTFFIKIVAVIFAVGIVFGLVCYFLMITGLVLAYVSFFVAVITAAMSVGNSVNYCKTAKLDHPEMKSKFYNSRLIVRLRSFGPFDTFVNFLTHSWTTQAKRIKKIIHSEIGLFFKIVLFPGMICGFVPLAVINIVYLFAVGVVALCSLIGNSARKAVKA